MTPPIDRTDIPLSKSARLVLERRYLRRDEARNTVETPSQMFRRVANSVAAAEARYDADPRGLAEGVFADRACELMASLRFLPNSPTLMNAGLEIQQLAACFVLPVEDSLPGIFDSLKYAALIHQSGGGTGFAFSRLRPSNDLVQSTHGVASGPVSFMEVYDAATDAIKQGGARRGANMAILTVEHPDIERFVRAKSEAGKLNNFNLSVAVGDAFMQAALDDADYALINPRTGGEVGRRNARAMLALISAQAWQQGDPGLVFLDRVNGDNPTPQLGHIESTNPCGEQPLLPYESCTLGSIDVSKFLTGRGVPTIDWDALGDAVDVGVRFLDDVIDVNRYPSPEIERATLRTRKIGLGIMGFADLLFALGVAYDSEAALAQAGELAAFIQRRANDASQALGAERGAFPAWEGSIFDPDGPRYRNATRTTIAPTGTLSIIAGCSGGIEPAFALAYVRQHYLDGDDPSRLTSIRDIHPALRRIAQDEGWWTAQLEAHLCDGGALRTAPEAHMTDAPSGVRSQARVTESAIRTFVTAHEIGWLWHVRMQAVFQRHVDNAVSKTINFPRDAAREDIGAAFIRAWQEGCKGITVYRDGSRAEQVFSHPTPNHAADAVAPLQPPAQPLPS